MTKTLEFNLVLIGIPLNFIWEMLQMPLFVFPGDSTLMNNSLFCLQASVGDAVILLLMYWSVVFATRTRGWVFHLTIYRLSVFILVGILLTIMLEAVSVNLLGRWDYKELMPTLPVLGTGLAPLLQWLVIPLLVLLFVRNKQELV